MTRFTTAETTCAVCGNTTETWAMSSTIDFDGPDLDSRPGILARQESGIPLSECLRCGYVATDLAVGTEATGIVVARPMVESSEYQALRVDGTFSRCQSMALRCELLRPKSSWLCGMSWLGVAWEYDDMVDAEKAPVSGGDPQVESPSDAGGPKETSEIAAEKSLDARRRSAQWLLKLRPWQSNDLSVHHGAVAVDVLRRISQFGEARVQIETLSRLPASRRDRELSAVLRFQDRLCAVEDSDCHTASEAVGSGSSTL